MAKDTKQPKSGNSVDVEKMGIVQPDYTLLDEASIDYKYAAVMPVVDHSTEIKVDDDGERYTKVKRKKRCTSVLFSLHEQIMHPETGALIMRERSFNLRLPFVTYKNEAIHAGFKSEQIIRALLNMPACQRGKKISATDMFHLIPITEQEIRDRTRIASDPELAEKLHRLQEENAKPLPTLGDVLSDMSQEEVEDFTLPALV